MYQTKNDLRSFERNSCNCEAWKKIRTSTVWWRCDALQTEKYISLKKKSKANDLALSFFPVFVNSVFKTLAMLPAGPVHWLYCFLSWGPWGCTTIKQTYHHHHYHHRRHKVKKIFNRLRGLVSTRGSEGKWSAYRRTSKQPCDVTASGTTFPTLLD